MSKIQELEAKRMRMKILINSYYGIINYNTSMNTINNIHTLDKAYRSIKQEIYYLKKIEERIKKITRLNQKLTNSRIHSGDYPVETRIYQHSNDARNQVN